MPTHLPRGPPNDAIDAETAARRNVMRQWRSDDDSNR
jgi:hypothetical protein